MRKPLNNMIEPVTEGMMATAEKARDSKTVKKVRIRLREKPKN